MKKASKTNRTRGLRFGPELDLIEGCAQALRANIPVEFKLHELEQPAGLDAGVDVHIEGRECHYVIEAKRTIRDQHIGPILHQALALAERDERLLLCTTRVTEGVGKQLREHNVAYLDLGGNAFLQGEGIYIHIAGRKSVTTTRGPTNLTGTDIRLLGVFLRDGDTGEITVKELAERAGIAIGAVGMGRKRLADLRVLEQLEKKRWRVLDREDGLRRFAEGWATKVRHKLHPRRFTMLKPKRKGDLEQRLAKTHRRLQCLIGGERAAGHMARFLKTDHATLHVHPETRQATVEELLLVPDEHGPITILDRFGQGDEMIVPGKPALPLAQPLLVWAECMAIPDERVAQVAKHLYREYLANGDA